MIKATKHKPPLTHADVKMLVEGSPEEERRESPATERREKRLGLD